jgi:predicted PurR-regulated permease PerM
MDLTVGKFLRFIIAIIFIAAIAWLIYSLSNIVNILIISTLIAYILDPIASKLESKGINRLIATILIFAILLSFIIFGSWTIFPTIFNDLLELQANLDPQASTNFFTQIESFLKENFTFVDLSNFNIQNEINNLVSGFTKQIISFAANLVSVVSTVVIIPFVTFFLLKDGREMKKLFISYIPNRYFEMSLNVLHKIDMQLGGYLRGQFIEAFVVGSLAIIALWILGIQYFILIGIFAGLANLIPYVGPVAGAIPAIIIAITNGADSNLIIYIIFAFIIIQLIDNVVMQPLVLSKSVNMHPLIIVIAILIGGKFFGILGMFLAVPAAGILKVTSSEIYNGVKKFNII